MARWVSQAWHQSWLRLRVPACLLFAHALAVVALVVAPLSHASPPSSYTLIINLTPAMCALNPNLQQLRQCQEGFSLTVSSLKPEQTSGATPENCSQTLAQLPPLQERIVERVMPDPQLRDSDWQRVGSCTGMTAKTYFRTIANYAGRLRVPAELNSETEMVVKNSALIKRLVDLNAGLPAQGIQLRCNSAPLFRLPVLTQLRVCYNPQGQYVNCPSSLPSNCPARFIVHGSP